MPEPIMTPVLLRSASVFGSQPASFTASCAAPIAMTMKSSIFFWSLGVTYSSGLKLPDAMSPRGTWPAIFAGRSETSKDWIDLMPDSPLTSFFHTCSTPTPNGETMPIPVTTTRRMMMTCLQLDNVVRCELINSAGLRLDEVDGVLHREDLLSGVIGDLA